MSRSLPLGEPGRDRTGRSRLPGETARESLSCEEAALLRCARRLVSKRWTGRLLRRGGGGAGLKAASSTALRASSLFLASAWPRRVPNGSEAKAHTERTVRSTHDSLAAAAAAPASSSASLSSSMRCAARKAARSVRTKKPIISPPGVRVDMIALAGISTRALGGARSSRSCVAVGGASAGTGAFWGRRDTRRIWFFRRRALRPTKSFATRLGHT
mmetsp:Transcript_11441/g.33952  ORF Transcript_11441/g.33952 Transcript_11441/m.33952 type:complete len:215 (+) Transcript_11441:2370-3014(+)